MIYDSQTWRSSSWVGYVSDSLADAGRVELSVQVRRRATFQAWLNT